LFSLGGEEKLGEQALCALVALAALTASERMTACAIGTLIWPAPSLTLMVR
jgi:hypothetical protein